MTPRDFICTPSVWVTDSLLNGLSDDAELLFRRLASCTDKHWRFAFDPNDLAHSVRTAAFSPKRRFRAWTPDRVHRSLKELTAAGMLTRHDHGDRHWLQVARAYRYEKGRDPLGIDSHEADPEIPEIAAGPRGTMPLREETHRPEMEIRPSIPVSFFEESGNGRRTESEQSKADESRTRASASLQPSKSPPPPRKTRALLRREGDSGGRFARGVDDLPGDELWADLSHTLGLMEMTRNGALWERRLRVHRQALCAALQDFLTKPPVDRATFNPAAYITAAYEAEVKRAA